MKKKTIVIVRNDDARPASTVFRLIPYRTIYIYLHAPSLVVLVFVVIFLHFISLLYHFDTVGGTFPASTCINCVRFMLRFALSNF